MTHQEIQTLRRTFPATLRDRCDDYCRGFADGLLLSAPQAPAPLEPGIEATWAAREWRSAHVTAAGLSGRYVAARVRGVA
jgi:hypothetical protein